MRTRPLIPLYAAVLALCLPAHAQTPAGERTETATTAESKAPAESSRARFLAMASRMVAAGAEVAKIWPGYWPEDQAFVFQTHGEGALLISPGPRPAGFEPVADAELTPALRAKAFYHRGEVAGTVDAPFVVDFPIGQKRSAILVNTIFSGKHTAEVAFHEQFHAYQFSAFKGVSLVGGNWSFVDPASIGDRAGFAAAAETERRALKAALDADSADERKRTLLDYFALRRQREATMSAQTIESERAFERNEGTAEYAARMALVAMGEFADAKAALVSRLDADLSAAEQAFVFTWFRERSYGTGAALSYFLSLYDPAHWQARIAAGETPDAMLANLVGAEADPQRAAQARERFGFERTLGEIGPAIRAAERFDVKDKDAFLRLAPFAVTLDYPGPIVNGKHAEVAVALMAESPGVIELTKDATAVSNATMANIESAPVRLAVDKRPFLSEANRYFTALLPGAPKVNDRRLPPGEHRFERLRIEQDGYRLTIEAPVVVVVSQRDMRIAIAASAAENTQKTPPPDERSR